MIVFEAYLITTSLSWFLVCGDFPVCAYPSNQYGPHVYYGYEQFLVTYVDDRFYAPYQSIFGTRVTPDGTVLDSLGKLFYKGYVGSRAVMGFDGTNFLAVFRDSC